jgi:hypothetical protein
MSQTLFLKSTFLFSCLAVAIGLAAQPTILPLQRNHVLQQTVSQNFSYKLSKKASTDTLKLPFFDDFIYGPGYPDTNRWADRQVYINNDFGVNPPSYGVATFDQLDANGNPYRPFTQFENAPGDSLTSLPINLKDSAGIAYSLSDSIYLSFFYQAKGLGDFSKTADSFFLDMKNSFGNWVRVWRTSGGSLQPFRQVMIAMKDSSYLSFLHESFQFRFINFTHQWGNNNHFHVDYVHLDRNRRMAKTDYEDYAVSSPPTGLLKSFSSMPYSHYETDSAGFSADSVFFNVSNLGKDILNIEVKHKESYKGNVIILTNPVNNAANVPSFGFATRRFAGFKVGGLTGSPVVIDRVYDLREPSIVNAYRDNDAITTKQIFDNYYAYDDGTAETGFGFLDLLSGTGSIAVKFPMAKEDTLRAVSFFFNQSVKDVSTVQFTLKIWSDLTTNKVIKELDVRGPVYTDSINGFHVFILDTPFLIPKGNIYVGWEQAANYMLNVGLDRNYGYLAKKSGANANISYRLGEGNWLTNTGAELGGAPMIRVFVGKDIKLVASVRETKPLLAKVYPNPCYDWLQIDLQGGFTYRVLAFDGKVMTNGDAMDAINISTQSLAPGIYFLHLKTDDGRMINQKFVKIN